MKAIIEIMWEPIFTEKLHCSQQKLFFWLVKNRFSHFSYIPVSENSFSFKQKRFLTNSSFWLVETNFLSSRNGIVLFSRASLKNIKFGRTTLFKRNIISARGNSIFSQWKSFSFFIFQILLLVKGIFVQQKRIC